jgi:hypothetical protein
MARRLSATEVHKASGETTQPGEIWRERDLSEKSIKYLFVAGALFSVRFLKHSSGILEKTGHRIVHDGIMIIETR